MGSCKDATEKSHVLVILFPLILTPHVFVERYQKQQRWHRNRACVWIWCFGTCRFNEYSHSCSQQTVSISIYYLISLFILQFFKSKTSCGSTRRFTAFYLHISYFVCSFVNFFDIVIHQNSIFGHSGDQSIFFIYLALILDSWLTASETFSWAARAVGGFCFSNIWSLDLGSWNPFRTWRWGGCLAYSQQVPFHHTGWLMLPKWFCSWGWGWLPGNQPWVQGWDSVLVLDS